MFARATTIRGNPQAVDNGIAYLREQVMPVLDRTHGCLGLSMLADRDTGRCIATTAWESEAALHASDDGIRPLRIHLAEVLGGSLAVHRWQIAVLHREHQAPDGACTRVTWARTDPANLDRVVDAYRLTLLPHLEEVDGFCSASLMVDRQEGRTAGAVTYVDRETVERTRTDATTVREEFAAAMGSQIVDVAEFELVLAHLRVPETA
ncbi:hypothetical protein ACI789_02295 [Geodermatophilus sp. SYSU D00965]